MHRWLGFILVAFLAVAVAGCGNGDNGSDAVGDDPSVEEPGDGSGGGGDPASETVELQGVAATGAPLSGNVQAVNAAGVVSDMAIIAADGSFTVTIEKGAPYLVRAIDPMGNTYYAYAVQAGTANVTSLGNLAMFIANDNADLETLWQNWATEFAEMAETDIPAAVEYVMSGLADFFQSHGFDATGFGLFSTAFAADGTGFDSVMDNLDIHLDLANGTFTVTDAAGNVLDLELEEPGAGGVGEWTLTITGSVQMMGINQEIPSITIDNITPPSEGDYGWIEQDIRDAYEGQMTVAELTVTPVSSSDSRVVFRIDFSGTASGVSMSYQLFYTYEK